tara:strand:- start:295 stop:555 length:261 start_codon:yes stop_codon:yes gene_type:complete
MSNKRIDLTDLEEHFKAGLWHDMDTMAVIAELKKIYKREDELIGALKIIRDDLDAALEFKGYSTLAHEKSERTLQKIRTFANDASQ